MSSARLRISCHAGAPVGAGPPANERQVLGEWTPLIGHLGGLPPATPPFPVAWDEIKAFIDYVRIKFDIGTMIHETINYY